jgi:hypothetical protein
MTCIRALQTLAGRTGRQISERYAREGETATVQALRSLESETLRAIEKEHAKGPCRCERCEPVGIAAEE